MTKDKKRVSDGFLSLEGGCNSGRTPNLIGRNQYVFGTNMTIRGGWAMPRPGIRKIGLLFQEGDESNFNTRFQGANSYEADDRSGSLICMNGGRPFRIKLNQTNSFSVSDISIAGDLNPSNMNQVWMQQAENFLIIQDGQSKPFIYNGASSRRANIVQHEVPVGKQMAYCMSRLWIANGRQYIGGDILFGPSGTVANGFRDSILKFTENEFLNEGGAFGVPLQAGDITAMRPLSNINTALGQSQLIIFTTDAVFSNLVPLNRDDWKNLTTPLQTILQINFGAQGANSVVSVNGDLFYRSSDGIRSLIFAVRNFGEWGNKPISQEMLRVMQNDTPFLLPYGSGTVFDNRMLMTVSPNQTEMGFYHKGLVSLNFDLISGLRSYGNAYSGTGEFNSPTWEGVWTGINVLQILTVKHYGVLRCFAFVLSEDKASIELWEVSKDDHFDNFTNPIEWGFESRAMDYQDKFGLKLLESSDIFIDRIDGNANLTVEYRSDEYPCWVPWSQFDICSKNKMCEDDFGSCPTLPNIQEQYQTKLQLTQPKDDFNPVTKELFKTFFEVQTRFKNKGFFRVKQSRFNAYVQEEAPYGNRL